jgi:4-amino-4-deoxy-L-arabinose transferase-like glycosyltransferase
MATIAENEKNKEERELAPQATGAASALRDLYKKVEPYEVLVVIGVALAILLPSMASYTLIDPWETHYAEVARRILEDNDWVHLRAEDTSFRSKPALTFWLIAASLKFFGIATDGGYSGEFIANSWSVFAIRLPFVLCAVMGLTVLWSMLAKLVNRRVAWISFLVLLTCPFFFMVARQSITDMPMVATLIAALSCYALAIHADDEAIKPFWKGVSALHVFLVICVFLVAGQILYLFYYFLVAYPGVARGIKVNPGMVLWPLLFVFAAWMLSLMPSWNWLLGRGKGKSIKIPTFPVVHKRQLYMFWFFLLMGLSVLAKGPPGIALAGLVCLLYTLITGKWKALLRLELVRGSMLTALVAVPWHLAMFMKDGQGWYKEYFYHHMLNRFGKGVHGDTGTFDYFAAQLGIGMWPWIALLPAALATVLLTARRDTQEGRVRLLIGIWAIAGLATFCVSETKFHHYVLPVVPALAVLIAFWIDDYLCGRVRRGAMAILLAVPIVVVIARDFVGEQKQFIELYIYRYDRAWPSGEPWYLDLGSSFLWFGAAFAAAMLLLLVHRFRRYSVAFLLALATVFALWTMNVYMPAAAPHWGQMALHETYYADREIHGMDLQYYGLRDLADEWSGTGDLMVESALPRDFAAGAAMRVQIFLKGAGIPDETIVLAGSVSRVGENKFWIAIPSSERNKLSDLIAQGKGQRKAARRPWRQVNADRLIAWQLNWHGEDFWSNGEMYGEREDAKTIFKLIDNTVFLEWINNPERAGRTFFIITEASRAKSLQSVLPTQSAKDSLEILDTSCNKFTLVRFTL